MDNKKKIEENIDYYFENGLIVFTELFHKKRGFCCGNGCKNCAFEPKHIKNNTKLNGISDKKNDKTLDF